LEYTFTNTLPISVDNSIAHLGCIGLRYTTKDDTDKSSITIELPLGEKLVLSRRFIEWFRGFIDAEGSFIIA